MKRNTWATQGRLLVAALMRRPHTYAEMLALGAGCSPWKRLPETLKLFPNLRIEKGEKRGLVTWRVVKVKQ